MGPSGVRCPSGYNREGGETGAGLSHQSQCGRGSEVTLAPHLVQNSVIEERRGDGGRGVGETCSSKDRSMQFDASR